MKIRLMTLLLFFPLLLYAKIYDCFPFFNELELLQIRLGELGDTVDYFVLVESIETQRGNSKQLFFEENKHLFAPYLHKIIHVAVRENHPEFSMWEREHFQRNCIARGLKNCKDKDIILISDLDEIPKKNCIREAKQMLKNKDDIAIAFRMPEYRFHLNRRIKSHSIFCTVATTYGSLKKREPQYFRSRNTKWMPLYDAGWHFTWMGGRDRIRTKMKSVVEGTDNTENMTDYGIDIWIRTAPIVPLDERLPQYVLDHVDELIELGFIAVE